MKDRRYRKPLPPVQYCMECGDNPKRTYAKNYKCRPCLDEILEKYAERRNETGNAKPAEIPADGIPF